MQGWESEWGGVGGRKKTIKSHKKGSHFVTKMTMFDVCVIPGNFLFFGVIFQNGFSPKAVQPEVPGFGRDPRTHLEARGPIWRYLVMK